MPGTRRSARPSTTGKRKTQSSSLNVSGRRESVVSTIMNELCKPGIVNPLIDKIEEKVNSHELDKIHHVSELKLFHSPHR